MQPVGVGRTPLGEKIVVGAHAGELQFGILEIEELLRSEPGDVGVQDLGPDPHLVHVLEALVGVVGGGRAVVVALPGHHLTFGVDAGGGDPHCVDLCALEHPDVPALVVANHMGDVVPPLRRHPGSPHICGLGDVGVGVDDPSIVHGVLHVFLYVIIVLKKIS